MSHTVHWVIHCDGDYPACRIKRQPVPSPDIDWARTLASRDGWVHLPRFGFDLCPTCRLKEHC